MEKRYFVSYWDLLNSRVSNIISRIIIQNIDNTQGEIALLIKEQLSTDCTLINFWEI